MILSTLNFKMLKHCKVEKRIIFPLFETFNEFIHAFCLSKAHFHQAVPLKSVETMLFFHLFGFSLTSLSRLFHSYRDEPIGRWGDTGIARENHLTHPQAELGSSHMWPVRGSNLLQTQR